MDAKISKSSGKPNDSSAKPSSQPAKTKDDDDDVDLFGSDSEVRMWRMICVFLNLVSSFKPTTEPLSYSRSISSTGLFSDLQGEDEEAERIKEERLAAYAAKKSKSVWVYPTLDKTVWIMCYSWNVLCCRACSDRQVKYHSRC